MPIKRMWIGNPGCAPEPCCEEETTCGQLCVTVRDSNTGSVVSGATINAGIIGSCTTGITGLCCFPIPPERDGTSQVVAGSKSGYEPGGIEVDLSCTTINVTLWLHTTFPGSFCYRYSILGCECPLADATLSYVGGGFTKVYTSDLYGRVTACFSAAERAYLGNWTRTVTRAPFVTQVATVSYFNIDSAANPLQIVMPLTDAANRYCVNRYPSGTVVDNGNDSYDYPPATLNVTFSGSGWQGMNGQTVVIPRLTPGNFWTWANTCTAIQSGGTYVTGFGTGTRFKVNISLLKTAVCGRKPTFSFGITIYSNANPSCTGNTGIINTITGSGFADGNGTPQSGSTINPIAVYHEAQPAPNVHAIVVTG